MLLGSVKGDWNMPTNKLPFTFHLDEDVLCKKCIREYEKEHGEINIRDEL